LDNFNHTDPINGFNVFILNWSEGASAITYYSSISNGRIVAGQVAYFISRFCREFKLSIDRWQFVGHSLGAHLSGWISRRLQDVGGKVARITALDPAGVGFREPGGERERLDSSAATLVDVIHTDGLDFEVGENMVIRGFGNSDSLGHFDFFPNSGAYQPRCEQFKSQQSRAQSSLNSRARVKPRIVDQIFQFFQNIIAIGCSHKAVTGMIGHFDDINSVCLPISYPCSSYKTFHEGRCATCGDNGEKCKIMGLYPDYWKKISVKNGQNTKLYTKTNYNLGCGEFQRFRQKFL